MICKKSKIENSLFRKFDKKIQFISLLLKSEKIKIQIDRIKLFSRKQESKLKILLFFSSKEI